jgi:hypothetical protein
MGWPETLRIALALLRPEKEGLCGGHPHSPGSGLRPLHSCFRSDVQEQPLCREHEG